MTEKEFLEAAFKEIWPDSFDLAGYDSMYRHFDKFLDQHHKEYFEVEFLRIEDGVEFIPDATRKTRKKNS